MTRLVTVFLTVLGCGLAATTNTTLTVNATASLTTFAATGTATLTGIGNGTFSGQLSLTPDKNGNLSAPFTITISGGTLVGTLSIPPSILSGTATSATGSATITSGTGTFAGATGSFPSLKGTGGLSAAGATLSFTGDGQITTGGSTGPPAPTITLIGDAAAYSSQLAQGSLFIVKGANLSASGFTQASFPLPTSLGGTSITFTPAGGGAGTSAFMVYVLNQSGVNQLAAVLPSTLAPGTYNVTVTNGTTSAPVVATVTQRRFAMFSQDASGTGLAIVQNFISASQLDYNRFTTGLTPNGFTSSPAKPGQALIAWGTGLGPVTTGDNSASPAFDFNANGVNIKVLVGGTSITPAYAGRAPGLAGEDQIVFTLPANTPTGCTVPLQISVNNVVSAATFLSIAPTSSASECVSPTFTSAQLKNFDNGGTYTTGGFSLTDIAFSSAGASAKIDSASGAFTQYTGFQIGAISPIQTSITQVGNCSIIQATGTANVVATGSGTNLDAGVVTLTGPSGSNISNATLTKTNNTYLLSIGGIGSTGNGSIVAGTYTLNGAGGADVGKFSATVTLGSPLTVTGGLPATINRSAGLTLNWTGGNATDLVEIIGSASTASGTTVTSTEFVCTASAGAGTFTVPASVLSQLPAASSNSGILEVVSTVNPTSGNGSFTAPLTAGGSVSSFFLALSGTGGSVAYQ